MDIIDEVRQVISKTLKIPIDQLTPQTRLDDIGAASLDVLEIVFELEEKFGISIPFEADDGARHKSKGEAAELEFRTIGEVANAVKALIDAKAPS
jgi:acyl carrier protein